MSKGADAMPELLTVEAVAEILNVSDRTIRRLCTKGDIPHLYVGSQLRIEKSDLENYINQNKKGAN